MMAKKSKSGIFHMNLKFRFIWNIPDFDSDSDSELRLNHNEAHTIHHP